MNEFNKIKCNNRIKYKNIIYKNMIYKWKNDV